MDSFRFRDHNITLPVYAHATLRHREPAAKQSTSRERDLMVWQPMKRFVATLATLNPLEIVCFHNGIYAYPLDSGGECTDVYLVGPDRAVAYIGTVFSQIAETAYRAKWAGFYQLGNRPDLAQQLQERDPTTTMLDRWFCRIPVEATRLCEVIVTSAVRQFLAQLAPTLETRPIVWWPESESDAFCKQIDALARQVAGRHQQTDEEQRRTIDVDEFQDL